MSTGERFWETAVCQRGCQGSNVDRWMLEVNGLTKTQISLPLLPYLIPFYFWIFFQLQPRETILLFMRGSTERFRCLKTVLIHSIQMYLRTFGNRASLAADLTIQRFFLLISKCMQHKFWVFLKKGFLLLPPVRFRAFLVRFQLCDSELFDECFWIKKKFQKLHLPKTNFKKRSQGKVPVTYTKTCSEHFSGICSEF